MTILLSSPTAHKYVGLSTDSKPKNVMEGSIYHAVDTGEYWVYHNFIWELDLSLATVLEAITSSIGQYQAENATLICLMEQVLLELKAANEANGIEVS